MTQDEMMRLSNIPILIPFTQTFAMWLLLCMHNGSYIAIVQLRNVAALMHA